MPSSGQVWFGKVIIDLSVRAISKMVEGLHELVEPLPVYKDPTQKMVEGKLIFF